MKSDPGLCPSLPLLIFGLVLLSASAFGAEHPGLQAGPGKEALYPEYDWDVFERSVRDGRISLDDGQRAVRAWAERLAREFPAKDFGRGLFFPLRGYSLSCFGGKHGEGYRPDGYRFLDGNRHAGHPAQDIFVYDADRDGLDDRTGRPVDVLSIADGVVMATFSAWTNEEPIGDLRGGNYIWIYHPAVGGFSYYAHLQEILVHPGERVPGGAGIATLGRSGTNAYPLRSPTHLHVMLLMADGMTPIDPYDLFKAGHAWSGRKKGGE